MALVTYLVNELKCQRTT